MKFIIFIFCLFFIVENCLSQSTGRKINFRKVTFIDKVKKVPKSGLNSKNNGKSKSNTKKLPSIFAKAIVTTDLDGVFYLADSAYTILKDKPLQLELSKKFTYYFISADTVFISKKIKRELLEIEKNTLITIQLEASADYEQKRFMDSSLLNSYSILSSIQDNMVSVKELYDPLINFQISKYEVTIEQFRQFIKDTNNQQIRTSSGESYYVINSSYNSERINRKGIDWRHNPQGIVYKDSEFDYPVTHVSFQEAVAFCKWLSSKDDNYIYRLPTKKEWQYVAGCGDLASKYPWGNSQSPQGRHANIADLQLAHTINAKVKYVQDYQDGYALTSPVGSFEPTCEEIYDLAGNVAEWCQDEKLSRNGTKERAFMGGSYFVTTEKCALKTDYFWNEKLRHAAIGFRVCREFKVKK